MSYGPRLKAHRENGKVDQATVARRMKITQPEVSRFEKGEPKRPSAEQFRALAYGYNLPLVTVLIYADYLTERDIYAWAETADGHDLPAPVNPPPTPETPEQVAFEIARLSSLLAAMMGEERASREDAQSGAGQ